MSRKNSYILITSSIITIIVLVWAVWLFISFGNVADNRSSVKVIRTEWCQVELGGKPLLYFSEAPNDTIMERLSEERDSAATTTVSFGRWANRFWWAPSCRGRIVADMDSLSSPQLDLKTVIGENVALVEKRLSAIDTMQREVDYYFSVHSVQDEGYMLVTEEYEAMAEEEERLKRVLERLKECQASDRTTITIRCEYKALYFDKEGKAQSDTCVFDGRNFRLLSGKTPENAKAISYTSTKGLGLGRMREVFPHPLEVPLDGLALRITPEKGVQLGEWKEGKYKGERLEYNSERIYGIDISRFQHESGRRRYSINWAKLRIKSLGTLSNKRINGNVDYPVSFCYIKSTEGTSVKNRYYAADYAQSRKHGIHTGTYHFFSTKTSGAKQAEWFFKYSKYGKGDLPPVLDVEPSASQIEKMGGAEAMFKEVRAWLQAVEKRWGVKPILYINQGFVNKYLPLAPDIKENYHVWIARYGEYKPDVHMAYWQLSPDGKVDGITPKVDINVFNGYEDRYREFIDNQAKK